MPQPTQTTQPAKPGFKTTEFWLGLAAVIVGVLLGVDLGGVAGTVIAVAAAILTALGYTVSRTVVKATTTSKPKDAGFAVVGLLVVLALGGAAWVAASAPDAPAICDDCLEPGQYERCLCCPATCCSKERDRCCCVHSDKCDCIDTSARAGTDPNSSPPLIASTSRTTRRLHERGRRPSRARPWIDRRANDGFVLTSPAPRWVA